MTLLRRPRPVTDERFELAEGPRWSTRRSRLVFLDLLAGRIHEGRWDGRTLTPIRVRQLDDPVGTVAESSATLLAGVGTALSRISDDGSREDLVQLAPLGHDLRTNDGACDPQGRMVCGVMSYDAAPGSGALVRLERTSGAWTIRTLLPATTISNGIAWSPDGATMYHVDSPTREIRAYDYGDSLGPARTVARIEDGAGEPDGVCVDAAGHIWVALWDGSEARRYSPRGELRDRAPVSASRPTAVCLGGPRLRTLFITSATYGVGNPSAHDGAIFAVDVDVPGLPATPWLDPEARARPAEPPGQSTGRT